ncbi:MAG: hypothetical protein KatS3mg092_0421 [Patescibacteria group bacterium]|nr:MAG: hypothetical protein KatS3mg092_0421 [Patescibacteria group bacterium]
MSANPVERNLKAKERIPNLIAAAVLGVSLYSSPDLQGSSTNIEQPPPPVPITNPSPSETSIPKNQIIENPSVNQALEAIQNYYSGLDTEKIFNNKESIKGPFVELRIPEIKVEDGKSELFYPKEINSYGLIIDSDGKSNLILIPPSIQIGGQEFNAKLVNEPKSSTYKITYTNSSGVSVDLDLEKTVISGQPVIQSPKDTIIISTTGESNGWIAKLSTNIGGNNNETINASYFIDDNKINIIINGYQINLPLEELSKYINFEDESNGKLEVILDNQEPNIAVLYHNDKYFGEINLSDGSFIIELNQSYITSKNIMNIRKGPSTSESKIGQLTPDNFKQIKYLETVDDKGTKIDPNDPNNDNYWHKVDLGNGQIGYIAGKLNGQEYSILQQETQNLKINPDNNIILLPKPDFEKNEIKSSIGNFVNALNKAGIRITPEQVTQGLTYQTIEVPKKDPKTGEVIKDEAGNEVRENVVVAYYSLNSSNKYLPGDYHFFIFNKDKDRWEILTPGRWWKLRNKFVGVYMGGELTKNYSYRALAEEHFGRGGILALDGQVRPGPDIEERIPNNSASLRSFDIANQNNMGLLFHYVAEPGKYPDRINSNNVDQWLSERLKIIAQLTRQKLNIDPILVEYNEPFLVGRVNYRNTEREPLRDKHGETDYLGYFIYQTYKIFVDSGLEPGRDFIIIINDNTPALDPNSISYIEQVLVSQRQNAFRMLLADNYNINEPDQIPLILGLQTNNRSLPPEELQQLLTHIQYLDVLLTEVHFYPERGNPAEDLTRYVNIVNNNSNVRGLILFRPFQTDAIEPITEIFDENQPNIIYYQLLR